MQSYDREYIDRLQMNEVMIENTIDMDNGIKIFFFLVRENMDVNEHEKRV